MHANAIDTKATRERRALRFRTLPEAVAEAERCAAAERDGRLRRLGNWTPGQAFGHLAAWATYPFEGYPPSMPRPPLVVRLLGPLLKRRFLTAGLPAGFRLPKVKGGTYGIEPVSTDEGLSLLREAFARLDVRTPEHPNPVFGRLSHEEWKGLNLRHAELHLGFLDPGEPTPPR